MWGPIAVQGVTGTDIEDALDEQLDHLQRGLAAHDKTLDDDAKAAVQGAIEAVNSIVASATMGEADATAYDVRILGHTNPNNSPSLGGFHDHLEIHIFAAPNQVVAVQGSNAGPQPGLAPAPDQQVDVPPASQQAQDEGVLRNVTPPNADQQVQVPVGVGQASSTDAGPTVGDTAGDNVQRIIDPIDGTSAPDSQTASALNPPPNSTSDALPADPNVPSATGTAVPDPNVPELTTPTSAVTTDAQIPDATGAAIPDPAASQPPTQPSSDSGADTAAPTPEPASVSITNPEQGAELTGEQFSFSGSASSDGTVTLYDGDATLAEVTASGGSFGTVVEGLSEGSHSLWARLTTGDGQVTDSPAVVVSVISITSSQ